MAASESEWLLEQENARLRDRNTTLEHVLHLQWSIDQHFHDIAKLQREAAILLQGSSPVPNN